SQSMEFPMHSQNFGPWTTALTTDSRLELSAFWRGRMLRLEGVAGGDRISVGRRISALGPLMIVAALFPMIRPHSESAAGFDETVHAIVAEPNADNAPASDPLPDSNPVEVALSQLLAGDTPKEEQEGNDLQKALRAAVAYLSEAQRDDGSW